ncbi:MAG: GntR family transcriptional regulator [Betaproteobacteria bacterium]
MTNAPSRFDPAPTLPTQAPTTLAEQVYSCLKTEMNQFMLVPGDRLSEADIGTRLGVSRTPVRQALFRLRDEGFLEVEAKSGWYVKPLDFAKLDNLYDLRITLELASVTKLCQRPESDNNSELDSLISVWLVPAAERLADAGEVGALDEQFHTTLVRAAGNDEASRVHLDVTERIRIIRRLDFTRGDRIAATYAEHAKILRSVIQRKASQAKMLLSAHIEQSKIEVRKITLSTLYDAHSKQL